MTRTQVTAWFLASSVGAAALGASPYGSVEFRWRERGLGLTNWLTVPAGATPSGPGVTNPTVTTDARFHLILEARVTRAAGNTDLGGLAGFAFNLVSSDSRAQGQFAASVVGSSTDLRNQASASVNTYNSVGAYTPLPAGATALPGGNASGDRGLFGPFRRVADLGGSNQPAIGVQNLSTVGPLANNPTLENITVGALTDALSFVDPDTGDNGPYFGRNDFYGLNTWVPVFYAVYNIADVSTFRNIQITAQIAGVAGNDSGLRGFRGINNAQGVDSWVLDNAGLPSFGFPAPATALPLLGLLALAKRSRNRLA